MKCHHLILDGVGLFCVNFSFKRNHWKPCLQVWCRPCNIPLDNHEFPVALPFHKDGLVNDDALAQDLRILKCIRRANLDVLWSLEPRTVN